jgi:hypothetical protein
MSDEQIRHSGAAVKQMVTIPDAVPIGGSGPAAGVTLG